MTEQIPSTKSSNKQYLVWGILLLIILSLTLPFHYVPSAMKMFPKDHFTFKHTIVTEEDINEVIRSYNNANNIFEQNAMNNDPFIRTLREQGIIIDKPNKNNSDKKEDEGYDKHDTSSYTAPPSNPSTSDIDFLSELNGKYPNDVHLLDNSVLEKRLKNLIGDRYDFLKEKMTKTGNL